MSRRIWELDALRGLCILGMILVHLVYDIRELYGLADFAYPAIFSFVMQWGSVLFLLISGICVTLGHHPVRRGLAVFGCGMLCSLVTAGMYWLGFQGRGIVIWFGILHCLGVCMLLWPWLGRLPNWVLGALALLLLALGYWFRSLTVAAPWLFPLGLTTAEFASSDYFPLLPNLGWFLIGALLGRTAYRQGEGLLPRFPAGAAPVRFLTWCGRQSLLLYLLHQPVLAGLLELYVLAR